MREIRDGLSAARMAATVRPHGRVALSLRLSNCLRQVCNVARLPVSPCCRVTANRIREILCVCEPSNKWRSWKVISCDLGAALDLSCGAHNSWTPFADDHFTK
jgi:hypothetical protein